MGTSVVAVIEHRPQTAAGALRRAIGLLAAEIARSLWPTPENRWLTAVELLMARRSTRFAAPFMIAAGFVVAQSCADWISWDVRIAWSVAVATLALTLHVATRHLEKRSFDTIEEVRSRALWQTGFTFIFLMAWCSMGVFLWARGAVVDHMFIALVLAASLAGSVSLAAAHPATALAVIVSHAIFLIAPLAFSTLPLDHALAVLSVAFVSMMSVQAVVLHGSHKKMFMLEHERASLVEGLRLAKQESDRDRARASAASRTKSQFLSNMNHELRTPMNAILGFSELIKHKAFGTAIDKYAEYAEIIHQSGQNLLGLIDDMLDLAKIEGGKLSLRESEVDLGQLIFDIYHEYESRAGEAQLSLLKKVSPGLPRVFADDRALRQIVVNLMSNAVKFTPAGGCVTLFAQLEADGRIAFGVDDTGMGIAEEDQSHVFERFGRGRHDVTTLDKGTGLGLAIVKGFAEAHDGVVELASALGAGTRVTAYLPAERVRAQPTRNTA